MLAISEVNNQTKEQFISTFGDLYENTPTIAEKAFSAKPFRNVSELENVMASIVRAMSIEDKCSLIRAHPKLGQKQPMGASSTEEQASAGLNNMTQESEKQLLRLNDSYSNKFRFPFVIFVAENNKKQILAALATRMENNNDEEISIAIEEIIKIANFRLLKIFSD